MKDDFPWDMSDPFWDGEPWAPDPEAWKGEDDPDSIMAKFMGGMREDPFWYCLDEDNKPFPCDVEKANAFMGNRPRRRVGNTYIWLPWPAQISTVFLALDHNWGEGPPVLFETMIFGGPLDQFQWRYCTWEEAEEGHKKALLWARLAPFLWVRDRIVDLGYRIRRLR
jgi:hypothetical protein